MILLEIEVDTCVQLLARIRHRAVRDAPEQDCMLLYIILLAT